MARYATVTHVVVKITEADCRTPGGHSQLLCWGRLNACGPHRVISEGTFVFALCTPDTRNTSRPIRDACMRGEYGSLAHGQVLHQCFVQGVFGPVITNLR